MKLNKLKIRVIPQRPSPSQAVFGMWPAAFHSRSFSPSYPVPSREDSVNKASGHSSNSGGEGSELLGLVLGTAVASHSLDRQSRGRERLTGTEEAMPAGALGARVRARRASPRPVLHTAGPSAQFLCSEEGRGGMEGGSGCCGPAPPPSQLLQTAVHLPFALLPCPGPALGAELLQVFFEVLVVHGPVAGGLTVRLRTREDDQGASASHC